MADQAEQHAESVPLIRRGTCSACGGSAAELWFRSDWWHNEPAICNGRWEGRFVARIDGSPDA